MSSRTADAGIACADAVAGTAASRIAAARAAIQCLTADTLRAGPVVGLAVALDRVVVGAREDDPVLGGDLDPHPRPLDAGVGAGRRAVGGARPREARRGVLLLVELEARLRLLGRLVAQVGPDGLRHEYALRLAQRTHRDALAGWELPVLLRADEHVVEGLAELGLRLLGAVQRLHSAEQRLGLVLERLVGLAVDLEGDAWFDADEVRRVGDGGAAELHVDGQVVPSELHRPFLRARWGPEERDVIQALAVGAGVVPDGTATTAVGLLGEVRV